MDQTDGWWGVGGPAPVPEPGCVFCHEDQIAAPLLRVLVARERFLVFEPLAPVTPGHRLVVPQRHVENATTDLYLTALAMHLAASVAKWLPHGEDFNIITSAGPAATQTVNHLHLHVVPRRPGDGLSLPWTGQQRA